MAFVLIMLITFFSIYIWYQIKRHKRIKAQKEEKQGS